MKLGILDYIDTCYVYSYNVYRLRMDGPIDRTVANYATRFRNILRHILHCLRLLFSKGSVEFILRVEGPVHRTLPVVHDVRCPAKAGMPCVWPPATALDRDVPVILRMTKSLAGVFNARGVLAAAGFFFAQS